MYKLDETLRTSYIFKVNIIELPSWFGTFHHEVLSFWVIVDTMNDPTCFIDIIDIDIIS